MAIATNQRAIAKATATPPGPALNEPHALTDSGPVRKLYLDVVMTFSRSRERDAALPWRAWAKTARWQRLRWSVLVRDLFTCQSCRRIEADTSLLVADHKQPHRGDERLFWDVDNLQCLCKGCHDTVKQAEEQATLHQRGVWY